MRKIIDLRTLWPLGFATAVFASVEKTGRLIVAHEAVAVSGFGAEIAATRSRKSCHHRLKAPVQRPRRATHSDWPTHPRSKTRRGCDVREDH